MKNNYTISFAQNREDIILSSFFLNKKKGFYVDIGANDPKDDSVTKYFYDIGWNGINVEPSPMLFERLQVHRKRDINLNIGISNKEGVLNFREYEGHGLSTFSEQRKGELAQNQESYTTKYKDYAVKVLKLKDVIKQYCSDKHIDFMKIDVEGYEYEVIESNDWSQYRPSVLCIESNHMNKDWTIMLSKNNYYKVYNDGLNDYYIDEKSKDINFDYLNSAVGRKIISSYAASEIEDLDSDLTEALKQCQKMELENQIARERIAPLIFENQELRQKINDSKRLRKQAIELAKTIDKIVMVHIKKLDYKTIISSEDKNNIEIVTKKSTEELKKDLEIIDINCLYDSKQGIIIKKKKAYLVVNTTYNFTKKHVKKTAIISYKVAKKIKRGLK
jgi:FkbM family methyltransferase